ncbi:MAG: fdhD [Bryobacterales bacterium]|nr:fdhD [Bryobacterales bacterium]
MLTPIVEQASSYPILTVDGRKAIPHPDFLAIEEPLEIRIGFQAADRWTTRSLSITMRTPGHDFELAAGFLFSEGIISSRADVAGMQQAGKPDANVVRVDMAPGVAFDPSANERHFYTTSSCGVCGKSSLDALANQGCEPLPRDTPVFDSSLIHKLPSTLRSAQLVFDRTGGLHASCLFDAEGAVIGLREDVGRHNALDKLIGWQLLEGRTPLHHTLLMVSGRASFELVQKAAVAGIPVLAAVGAPSSLAVDLAREFDMTLLGFVRDERFNIYSGEWRIRYETENEEQLPAAEADPE